MTVSFDIEDSDVELLISSLHYVASITPDPRVKQRIDRLIREIQFDVQIDNLLLDLLRQLLQPYTSIQIDADSRLVQELSIDPLWIQDYLPNTANSILSQLMVTYHPGKTTDPISSAESVKCETVQDVIDLIKNKFDAAS